MYANNLQSSCRVDPEGPEAEKTQVESGDVSFRSGEYITIYNLLAAKV